MCGKGLWTEVFLYSYGMLSLIIGMGFMIASIDPKPLPLESSWYFLGVGTFLFLSGFYPLALLLKMQNYTTNAFVISPQNEITMSVVELLDDSQFMGHTDSPIVVLRDSHFGITNNSYSEKMSSDTLSSVSTTGSGVFYYKETFV